MPQPPDEHREAADDLSYHRAKYPTTPLLEQVDAAAAYIVRDLPPRIARGLRETFPAATRALPAARWRQIGFAALGLFAVNWLVTLNPQTAQALVGLAGLGLAGYAGLAVLRHSQQSASDSRARSFADLTAQLEAPAAEQRIAALGALDQLAYDHPRFRRPLIHLLSAWLDRRAAEGAEAAGGHDCRVARLMLAEFWQMLLADGVDRNEAAPRTPAAAAATPSTPAAAVAAAPTETETPPLAADAPADEADAVAQLSVVEREADADEPLPAAEPADAEPGDIPSDEPSRADQRRAAGGE